MKQQNTQSVGALGEDLACRFLVKKGFEICDRNYRKKYGEIDIIAKKHGRLCFVEVKSALRNIGEDEEYRPEEKVHRQKLRRLSRAIETYLLEKSKLHENWDFLVLVVFINKEDRSAIVKCIEDVV
ncbi:MAG: YraN family protein, partial [Candidatus Pacebacteria bacterium]|nr:YraN family protein [Candidatus Paceibacterota bacterium]